MDFLQYQQAMYHPAYTHQHPSQYSQSQEQFHYMEHPHRSQLYMARRSISLDGLRQAMAAQGEKNETKARLAKDQVEILEAKFQDNNKPNSQTKRLLAQEFGVEQARINNWFQNRRAKAKQERKQMEHDAQKGGDMPYHDGSTSPELFDNDMYDEVYHGMTIGDMAEVPIINGPSASVPPFHHQYDNVSTASMHSLARTLSAAQDALARGDFSDEFETQVNHGPFSIPAYPVESRAPFPIQSHSNFAAPTMPVAKSIELSTQHVIPAQPVNNFFGRPQTSSPEQTFPSQLLHAGINVGLPSQHYQSHAMMPSAPSVSSPEGSEASFALNSIPGPSNIASRRAKQRPANLGVDALKNQNHGMMNSRSYSSSDIPSRLGPQSPVGSPMRRVNSNQVGMSVISGRVQKMNSLPARSPMAKSFNNSCENYLRDVPQTVNSNLHREFPPTPSSPYEQKLVPRTQGSTSSSPLEHEPSFFFHSGALEGTETGSTMASPPETPHNPIVNNHWNFEILDQPLQTPQYEMFSGDMHLQMPPFVSPVSASQPNTPAFGNFSGFPMPEPYDQSQLEYMFPGGNMYTHSLSDKSSPMSLQKTFTFNNVTQESLKELQRKTEEREKTPVSKSIRA